MRGFWSRSNITDYRKLTSADLGCWSFKCITTFSFSYRFCLLSSNYFLCSVCSVLLFCPCPPSIWIPVFARGPGGQGFLSTAAIYFSCYSPFDTNWVSRPLRASLLRTPGLLGGEFLIQIGYPGLLGDGVRGIAVINLIF